MIKTLSDLEQVFGAYPEASDDPVVDLANRHVDEDAVDGFLFECMRQGLVNGLTGDQMIRMVAFSCFHAGMLTQDFLEHHTVEGHLIDVTPTEDDLGGYDANDPKSPGYHSRLSDLWDMREGK